MPKSWVNTEYSIHLVQHHPKIDSLPLPACFSSLGRWCTQLSTFLHLQVNQWMEAQLPSRLPGNRPPPSTPPISLDHSLQVYLWTRSATASECISEFTPSRPPSACPKSLDHGLQVTSLSSLHLGLQAYLLVQSISASKCISKPARSRPQSISLRCDGGCTEIQGQRRFNERSGVYI